MVNQNKALAAQAVAAQCSSAAVAVANRAVDDLFSPNFVIHNAFPGHASNAAGTKQWNAEVHAAFPDYSVKIDDQIAEGDKVVTRWTAQGTHKGQFQGIAPTGKHVSITGTTINRYVNGKIAEAWVQMDTLGLMRQLGVSPGH
jgi:steroid delta-isomerase-like uncharacterized protein